MDADVVIAWAFAPVPDAVKALFTRPTVFPVVPTPANQGYKAQVEQLGVRGILAQYAPGVTPLRVGALGFSEACQGPRAFLSGPDGRRFDSIVAIDGIHAQYVGPKAAGVLDSNYLVAWLAFAKLAAQNKRLCAITHSSIDPPTFVSTTDTAAWIWRNATGADHVIESPPVPDLSIPPTTIQVRGDPMQVGPARDVLYAAPAMYPARRDGGLAVLGYANLDTPWGTADHIYQAQDVLPMVLGQFLAERWNQIDPKSPDATCFIG